MPASRDESVAYLVERGLSPAFATNMLEHLTSTRFGKKTDAFVIYHSENLSIYQAAAIQEALNAFVKMLIERRAFGAEYPPELLNAIQGVDVLFELRELRLGGSTILAFQLSAELVEAIELLVHFVNDPTVQDISKSLISTLINTSFLWFAAIVVRRYRRTASIRKKEKHERESSPLPFDEIDIEAKVEEQVETPAMIGDAAPQLINSLEVEGEKTRFILRRGDSYLAAHLSE